MDITAEYLLSIQNTYFEYFKMENQTPVLIIDVSKLDYLNNPEDYQKIVNEMSRKYTPGLHHASFVQ